MNTPFLANWIKCFSKMYATRSDQWIQSWNGSNVYIMMYAYCNTWIQSAKIDTLWTKDGKDKCDCVFAYFSLFSDHFLFVSGHLFWGPIWFVTISVCCCSSVFFLPFQYVADLVYACFDLWPFQFLWMFSFGSFPFVAVLTGYFIICHPPYPYPTVLHIPPYTPAPPPHPTPPTHPTWVLIFFWNCIRLSGENAILHNFDKMDIVFVNVEWLDTHISQFPFQDDDNSGHCAELRTAFECNTSSMCLLGIPQSHGFHTSTKCVDYPLSKYGS